MNSCSLSEMTFYLMFTLSLFISRVIGYAKYTDIRRAREKGRGREREREREDKIRAIIFNERGAKLSRGYSCIYIYISVLSHNHRLEETKMFLILIGSAILIVYVSLVKVKVKY